ncbi:hypothetical protein MKS88_000764 [Plasmodium brasilianum]|uniref:Uncharacterized protein n=2 Tax=Plasmodium (Plasmodium) TaxID=418103 RepID=A0A1A8VN80_PLAMA|nr:conserved Plasmodium protein, unknown function [Plasmodium malariae]KAI4840997.1 hypothetical protein MKS88_000764 [Plasmodium brasilianum]SBS81819.1 conserved Plasmodium protein, unknown function [Plasmodium malariae]SBT70313.1 conserved Plasmodium protein, unknown function [Plasmodium malariae]SBT87200.1 conserved Plasmodium protein, unknown function [Plasmodium malariae]
MNNIKNRIAKEINNFKRTALLKGSPAFRISVWFSGLTVGLVWILISEYNHPKNNNLFFKKKEAELFTYEEIKNWNRPYYSKSDYDSLVLDHNLTADEKRKLMLKEINEMEQNKMKKQK